ncbi:MAG: TraR/DksA C4-type zinc finger protein [Acidimicrobiia bacterium]
MPETADAVLRDQLEDEREKLVEQLGRLGHGDAAGSDGGLDFDENFADSGQVTAERGEADAIAGQLEDTLAEIDEALAKFDAGTYGQCEQCGQRIGDARLEAMPAARYCIDHASRPH